MERLIKHPLMLLFICLAGFGLFGSQAAQACNTSSTINISACDFYTSPSGKYTWVMSGIYLDTIPNSGGCDSVIFLAVTINTLVAEHEKSGDSLEVKNFGSATYQWIACDFGNAIIPNATAKKFRPDSSGNYAAIVTQGACIDTSHCQYFDCTIETLLFVNRCDPYTSPSGKQWNSSGTYYDTLPANGACKQIFEIHLTVNNQKPTIQQHGIKLMAVSAGNRFIWLNCDSAFAPTGSGDTLSAYTPPSNGRYAVVTIKNGCPDTSDCFNFTHTALEDAFGSLVLIYPNPANQDFVVEAPVPVRIRLYSPDGKLVQEYGSSLRTEIKSAHLPSGTYFVKVIGNEGVFTEKVVVIH